MIHTLNVTKTIVLPVDKAWSAIAQIGGLERWFPMITDCKVSGSDVGATRILTLANGAKMTDRIEAIDHQNRCFQYNRIESPFPVNRYRGTINVSEIKPTSSEIIWSVEIDVDNENRDDVIGFLQQALSEGIDGLELDLLTTHLLATHQI